MKPPPLQKIEIKISDYVLAHMSSNCRIMYWYKEIQLDPLPSKHIWSYMEQVKPQLPCLPGLAMSAIHTQFWVRKKEQYRFF